LKICCIKPVFAK